MIPTDYILPPDQVRARFPQDLIGTPMERAIVDACAAMLGPIDPGAVEYCVSNMEGSDFNDQMVTLTVRPAPIRSDDLAEPSP
ncbi:hypothetical protein [Nocardia africana]